MGIGRWIVRLFFVVFLSFIIDTDIAHSLDFDFALDSFDVDGNILGSGDPDGINDFFDNFNDGSLTTPPTSSFSFSQGLAGTNESNGFLNFRSIDGAFETPTGAFDDAVLSHLLQDGLGDSIITGVFRADVPELLHDYTVGVASQADSSAEAFFVFVRTTTEGTFVFAGDETEVFASNPVDLSLISRIHLRLEIFDDINEIIPSYSIDGGNTFIQLPSRAGAIFTVGSQAFAFAQGGFISPDPGLIVEPFVELIGIFIPFNPTFPLVDLLVSQQQSLEASDEVINIARQIPDDTVSQIILILVEAGTSLLTQYFCYFHAICGPFIPPAMFCTPPACVLDGNVKQFEVQASPTSTFLYFSFDLSFNLEKSTLELFEIGDQLVTDIPFLGIEQSFSIVEVTDIIDPPETGIIEFSVEGVAVVQAGAELSIEKAKIKMDRGTSEDRFEVEGNFDLGILSNGIDVSNEDVTVTFNGFSENIPAGSNGTYTGITHFNINKRGKFKVKAKDVDLSELDLNNPVHFSLQIGDDFGEAEIPFDNKGHFR